MGRRGPAPKPTALKILDGNPGKRPISKREPKPTGGVPSMPAFLSREAKSQWKRLVAELPDGMLAIVDRADLALACVWWSFCCDNAKACDQKALDLSSKNWRSFSDRFGLTPSARTRIEVANAPPKKRGRPSSEEYAKRKTG